jgi:hypothetical protein
VPRPERLRTQAIIVIQRETDNQPSCLVVVQQNRNAGEILGFGGPFENSKWGSHKPPGIRDSYTDAPLADIQCQ